MKSKLNKIKLVLMDVDGVLTSGKIIYNSDGQEIKEFNVQDGMAITLARMAGLKTGIITGRISEMVKRRAEELQFDIVSQGSFDKLPEYEKIKKELKLKDEEIVYIGDDILDISILKRVGFSACVANARDEVKAICDYVCTAKGGDGGVREIIDIILKRQDKLDTLIEKLTQ
ncbi:MAG: HAD-IIIA family hydrolase [Calditrichaceae bacterium]|nr:HAD-IIIA family hydrolase [Calditrichaceae bacterium]MBN2710072.1 HAD-IIIA family hydrolase [Calditrichaceae bacterium]RQV94512.1 MAG: HAD-IIIA family hydrolase [Calditrichota bacterium]